MFSPDSYLFSVSALTLLAGIATLTFHRPGWWFWPLREYARRETRMEATAVIDLLIKRPHYRFPVEDPAMRNRATERRMQRQLDALLGHLQEVK